MKNQQKYPSFSYRCSLTTDGRIILLDEPLAQEVQNELKSLETADGQELLFLEDSQLATDTEAILTEVLREDCNALLVFPGNGSNYPRRLSQICQESNGASVYAKRFWQPGNDPIVTAGVILPEIFLIMNVKTVVVIDDVISSGLTMQKVHQNNAWRFTRAKWIGVSWVAQIPQMRAKSGVNGYEQIATACVVGKTNGARIPINSISTLRQNREIATSYAKRHFREPKIFLHLINITNNQK
ncbi:MAG: phosphoribosyltransferase [Patescibacteria group bacterium]